MKFLADENFPKPLSNKIRSLGHSVKTIQGSRLQGSSDQTVLETAQKKHLILLTFDKDFLIHTPLTIPIIVFDFPRTPTPKIITLIGEFPVALEKLNPPPNTTLIFNRKGLTIA